MIKLLRITCLATAFIFCLFSSQAQMRITEWMYDATPDKEFVEYTNVGSTPIDMTGWKYSDAGRLTPGSPISLSAFGMVQPGESVIFCEVSESAFRTSWTQVCSGTKIIGGSTTNLGRSDEVNLYDASDNLIDRLTYGDQAFPGTIRTTGASGWVSAAGLNVNNPALWTLSTVGDAEGSYASVGGAIGSPGKSTRATVVFTPVCGPVPGAPTIVINVGTTSNFLDAGASVAPNSPFSISGVKGDAGDPASTLGIDFTIGDDITAVGSLLVAAVSSNQTVVPAANINLTGTSADRNLKITPIAVGYSNITITVTDGDSKVNTFVINYAASQSPAVTPVNYWPTGIADASAGIALDDNYMIIANDESNLLYVFDRKNSGQPVKTFDFNQGNALNLSDGTPGNYKEVDVEAGVRSLANPAKIYWLGSMSNNSSNAYKPNRDRLFTVTVSGTGAAATFTDSNYVDDLRNQLITWGDSHGYNFTAAAADLHSSKVIDGFNIEGMAFGPDDKTMYIGFRAPLVPLSGRVNAVIAPIQNFESWINHTPPIGSATIGAPIELNLGGRGIRDLIRLSNGYYIIIAGSYDETAMGAVYKWTGNPADAPTQITSMDISALNVEGVLPVNAGGTLMEDRLQVISDNGDNVWYADGTVAKDLGTDNFKKFSSNVIIAPFNVLPVVFEYFTANKQGKSVVLNWKSAQMEGVERFEILRSVNGTDFTSIGFVPAAMVQTTYAYTDNAVTTSGKVYYRIRSVEHNGSGVATPIRYVDLDSQLPVITLYPNPVVNNRFSIVADKPGTKTVAVYSSNGTLFRQMNFNGQVTEIATIGWPKGWYLINIKTVDGSTATYKVIVQ
jgi:hypothetical protein